MEYAIYDNLTQAQKESIDILIKTSNPDWLIDLESIENFDELHSVYTGGCAGSAHGAVMYHLAVNVLVDSDIEEYAMNVLDNLECYMKLHRAAEQGLNAYASYLCSVAVESWVSDMISEIEELLKWN